MPDNQNKKGATKRTIPLRSAGEKINIAEERPSARLFAEVMRLEAEATDPKTENQPPPPTTTHHPLPPPTNNKEDSISPRRDFTKFANSIVRDAVPGGLFKGTSKNTYDALYQRTRGAITPARTIKAVQSDVLIWTNVSQNTLRSHLKHLQAVGLIQIHFKLGDNNGAQYEVFLPEEVDLSEEEYPVTSPLLPPPTTSQFLGGPSYQFLVGGGRRLMPVNIEENHYPKTSFKDKKENDDETAAPFSEFLEKIAAACERVTGKPTAKSEREKWGTLADLLILELEVAAKKTDSISSAPAFLTEVLRRKLLSGASSVSKIQKTKFDTVGKPNEAGEYEKKPLDEKGRAEALAHLREFADDEFLRDFEKWYTREDWNWLIDELKKLNLLKTAEKEEK